MTAATASNEADLEGQESLHRCPTEAFVASDCTTTSTIYHALSGQLDTAHYPNASLWPFEKWDLMTTMESQTQQDEFLPRVTFVATAPTDEDLIAAAKSGDHPAFVELWTRHSSRAFKTAYRITGNRYDAEDAFQNTWMRAYMHLNTFDGRAQFSTWLSRIAINSSLMILRVKRAHPETSIEITDGDTWQHWEIADPAKNAEEVYATHERLECLRRAVRRLTPSLRNVLEMHQSTDSSLKEVAEFAGISVAATKSRLSRAKKTLRDAFELK
jgi:RNA polymerase sigma-70 factor, ECF subfamily